MLISSWGLLEQERIMVFLACGIAGATSFIDMEGRDLSRCSHSDTPEWYALFLGMAKWLRMKCLLLMNLRRPHPGPIPRKREALLCIVNGY